MKLAALLLVALSLPAQDGILAPGEGNWVRLEVGKTGVLKGKVHVFEFPAFQGKANSATPSFEIALESQKIVVKDDWVSAGDRKKILDVTLKDMLDAAKHPLIQFRSTTVVKDGSTYKASGLLTIRDRSQTVEVLLKENAPGAFEGSAEVDMRRFGLKPPSALLGAIGTDPIMKLRFQLKVN